MLSEPGLVVAVAYDGLCTFEFGIAVEVFGLPRPEFRFPWYRFAVAGVGKPPYRAAGGVRVDVDGGLGLLRTARTIVIPGWRSRDEVPPGSLVRALLAAHLRGARIVSICSGVFVLAATGLLDGRRATTHHRHLPALRSRYPAIDAVENALYVDEGALITSAGSTAGIDACLHLVRRDFGAAIANAVARRMVIAGQREGGRPQIVAQPAPPTGTDRFAAALDRARNRIDQPLSVRELASLAAMSERTFLRRFRQQLGTTPRAWLLGERVGRAQELLETTALGLQSVAEASGFVDPQTFRIAFRRALGVSPTVYRRVRRLGTIPTLGTTLTPR
jgi:AraC family transcriptional activator FtrA